RNHNRVEHHILRIVLLETGGNRLDCRGARHHADLHGADLQVGEHSIHLRRDELRRDIGDSADAFGVLRGKRRDDRGAVDSERRERLEIGLDAGSAAGIRARYGDGNRSHALILFASAASTTPSNSRAAASGSRAIDKAEMTDTPSAPASITAAALPALMPAMPQVGKPGLRRCSASMTRARPARPIGAFLVALDVVP